MSGLYPAPRTWKGYPFTLNETSFSSPWSVNVAVTERIPNEHSAVSDNVPSLRVKFAETVYMSWFPQVAGHHIFGFLIVTSASTVVTSPPCRVTVSANCTPELVSSVVLSNTLPINHPFTPSSPQFLTPTLTLTFTSPLPISPTTTRNPCTATPYTPLTSTPLQTPMPLSGGGGFQSAQPIPKSLV